MRIVALSISDPGIRYKAQIKAFQDAGCDVVVIQLKQGVVRKLERIFNLIRLLFKQGLFKFIKRRKIISQAIHLRNLSSKLEYESLIESGFSDTKLDFEKSFSNFSVSMAEWININQPDYVLQAGCGIIPSYFIKKLKVKILNIHPGILPSIRGVDPHFWALYYGRHDWIGSTLHLVDEGIDTGKVLIRKRVSNFTKNIHFSKLMGEIVKNESDMITIFCSNPISELPSFDESIPSNKSYYRSYWSLEHYLELEHNHWSKVRDL